MRSSLIGCMLTCVVFTSGCDRSDGPQRVPDQPIEPSAAAPQATVGSSTPEYADEDLPVAPDFEQEADKQITADNYEAELDTIAAEMGIDAGAPDGKETDAGSPADEAAPSAASADKTRATAPGTAAPAKPSPPAKPAKPPQPTKPVAPSHPAPTVPKPPPPVYE